MGDTHLSEIDGVNLYAYDRIEGGGDHVLMLLAPCAVDAKSAS